MFSSTHLSIGFLEKHIRPAYMDAFGCETPAAINQDVTDQ